MIALYKKYIRNKIFNKMLLIYSLITIISIFLLKDIFINYHIDNELQNELDIYSEVIFNIEKRFEEQDSITNSIANGINTQPKVIEEVKVLVENTYEEYLSYKLDKFSSSNMKQIDLNYLINTILSDRTGALAVCINNKDKEYISEIVLNYNKWYDLKIEKDTPKYIRKITKPIKSIDSMYTIAYIDIYFDLNSLNNIVENSNFKGNLMIFDENNNVIFNSDKNTSASEINYIKDHLDKSNEQKFPMVMIKRDVQNDYKYGTMITQEKLGVYKIKSRITYISLGFIVMILIVTYFAINQYSSKLKNMMKNIEKLKQGKLDTRFNIKQEVDELDMIAISIDEMSESLQYNINKNYIAEVKQKQAEINALQSQIKPHFLYNTLEVIRMSALSSKNKEVAQMIYNLASMFRYSTYNNGSLVSIRDEIKHSKMYLSLCSTRYKGMLDYSIHVDDKYLDYLVPKFTIQPILENAINHGLRKGFYDNYIKVTIKEIDEGIEISIKDNGNGMSEEAISKIKDELEKNIQKPNSIGLMNINNRLKLNFGEQYGIYINSRMNEGTTVSIKIPVLGDEVDNV
ncbi:sensor histidine kinase [Romboutsia timonensis]|uniref:sensor histidine kinase n=1 Tax=Romboutsia timonensis TaxID=1776391 RepID=UPI002A75EDBD|nr:sensor histidine kinase [Romboutsia timonensis]MDY3001101.1 sensor histidine kinase [Romboutsia timonensis]